MSFIFSINGRITPPEQSNISVLDRGFLYGDSVYEVLRTYWGKPFMMDAHLERLERSARCLDIEMPSRASLEADIKACLEALDAEQLYCRIIVTRGTGPLTLDPTSAKNPSVIIMAKDYEAFPQSMYEKGARLTVPKIRRPSKNTLDPAVKSGNYLNSVLALGEAKKTGFDDALLLNEQGCVTESTSSNIFAFQNGDLVTPRLEHGLLEGITRSLVIDLAEKNRIRCFEKRLSLSDIISSDEVVLTSTLREIMPVVEIDGTKIGIGIPGPNFVRLQELFTQCVRETLK